MSPQAADAEARLVRLCTANLTRFQHVKPDNGPEPAPTFADANGEPNTSPFPPQLDRAYIELDNVA